MSSYRIALVEDHKTTALGVEFMLANSEIEIVAIYGDAETAATAMKPAIEAGELDLVVTDLRLPGNDGVWLLEQVKAIRADLPVLFLSGSDDPVDIRRILDAGAIGFIGKGFDDQLAFRAMLRDAIRNQEVVFDPATAVKALRNIHSQAKAPTLRPQDRDILVELARGANDKEIADALGYAESTVKTYVANLREQWGARTRAQLVASALRGRLIE